MTTEQTTEKRKAGQPGPGQRRINLFISDDAYAMMIELGRFHNPTLRKGYGATVDRAIREAYERQWPKKEQNR